MEEVVHTTVRHHNHLAWCENADAAGPLTAVHLVAGVLAVDHLVTAAVVGDAASVFALELSYFAQGHCREAQGRILNKRKQKKNPTNKQTADWSIRFLLIKNVLTRLKNRAGIKSGERSEACGPASVDYIL